MEITYAGTKKKRESLAEKIWAAGAPWQPIETCPFKVFEYQTIFVSNGTGVAMAKVKGRFGRPMRCVQEPEMAITDQGMAFIGGKYEDIEAPDWWFEWELEDVDGSENYTGGEPIGKDEVPFVATHWLPMLTPPSRQH